jgi:hypothetical protein
MDEHSHIKNENISNENINIGDNDIIGLEMPPSSSTNSLDDKYRSLMNTEKRTTISELEKKYYKLQWRQERRDPIVCFQMRRSRCRHLAAELLIVLLFLLILAIIIGLIIIELDLMRDVRDLVPWE